MKKIILLFAALTTIATVSAEVSTPELDFNARTSETYNVGDIITVNGKRGVVFVVSSDGKHGRAVSLDGFIGPWEESAEWAYSYCQGWRMPNEDELKLLYNVLEEVNEAIFFADGQKIEEGAHWTSEAPNSDDCAWIVNMFSGNTNYFNRHYEFFARAVSAF